MRKSDNLLWHVTSLPTLRHTHSRKYECLVLLYKSNYWKKIQCRWEVATELYNCVHWSLTLRDPERFSLSWSIYKSYSRLAIRSRVCISCRTCRSGRSELSEFGSLSVTPVGGENWKWFCRCWWEGERVVLVSRGPLIGWGVTGSVESKSCTFLAPEDDSLRI